MLALRSSSPRIIFDEQRASSSFNPGALEMDVAKSPFRSVLEEKAMRLCSFYCTLRHDASGSTFYFNKNRKQRNIRLWRMPLKTPNYQGSEIQTAYRAHHIVEALLMWHTWFYAPRPEPLSGVAELTNFDIFQRQFSAMTDFDKLDNGKLLVSLFVFYSQRYTRAYLPKTTEGPSVKWNSTSDLWELSL